MSSSRIYVTIDPLTRICASGLKLKWKLNAIKQDTWVPKIKVYFCRDWEKKNYENILTKSLNSCICFLLLLLGGIFALDFVDFDSKSRISTVEIFLHACYCIAVDQCILSCSSFFLLSIFSVHFLHWYSANATQSLTQEPADTAVNFGAGAVTLRCVVAEKSGQLFWIKDGEHIGSDKDVTIPGLSRYAIEGDASAGEYNLKITGVALVDDGLYQCQVTPSAEDAGLNSHTAKLTVQSKSDRYRVS